MDKGCVLIKKNCTAELISIDKFNKKFGKIKNKGDTEFVLIPVSQFSEAYIAVPVINLPDKFSPMKIEYDLGIRTIYGRYNIYDHNFNETLRKLKFESKYKIECNTLYDLYVFAFSLKRLAAFNVLNNMSEIKNNPYDDLLSASVRKPYIFCIDSLNISYLGENINMKEVDGIEQVLDIVSTTIGIKHIITPCLYKFWIGKNHRCNFTPYSNPSKMIGTVNKISEKCIMSNQCINYDAYSFISTSDEVLLKSTSCNGELLMVNYTLMCEPDELPIDGPLNVMDMLKHPEAIVVYRVERYNLYTISDCVEALSFATDLLHTMDISKKLIGGDESTSESMIEIRLDGYDCKETLSYTLTKESIDFGEVTNVVSDFMNKLDAYLENNLPF